MGTSQRTSKEVRGPQTLAYTVSWINPQHVIVYSRRTAWCAQGIAGRGVLLDYLAWTELNNIKFDPFDTHKIPLTDLLACAKSQNLSFKHGDILLIRLGWKGRYMALDQQSRDAMPLQVPHKAAGVEASVDMARWLWDTGFSACAGDTAAFEVFPTSDPSGKGGLGGLILHEIMLGGWGMPIGKSHSPCHSVN